jgi:hypothetical protein
LEDEHDVLGLENILTELGNGGVGFHKGLPFEKSLKSIKELQNEDTHYDLRKDLIECL